MVLEHLIGFILGVLLDRIIGDPQGFPHPIRLIGALIGWLDRKLNNEKSVLRGAVTWLIVVFMTVAVTFAIMFGAYSIHVVCGVVVEAILTCYILAAKSLSDESMKVYRAMETADGDDLTDARKALSMIVGRDTENLDEAAITRAVVETIAENTSDGIIAPLIYTFLGGPILGFAYKAVNTMDSMLGYHNDRYEYFGKVAAKMDDVFNYIPARLSALMMVVAAFIGGRDFSSKRAFCVFKRDRYNHKSPNSAQTESACAGALGVRLGGDSSYFGKMVHKPYIGDDTRPIEKEDIKRAARLMFLTEYLWVAVLLAIGILLVAV
ncbi:MAG: cobalamin biosynthesis protein CobD [Butyrivibrio sp.]|uniref:adenosylcobinamide-phosphate synthase CbiB n=1 Tax=Butyrivibrio sp. TaxID=28121 RepID=UPI001B757F12|nr:adenosylcobinamide-phosphate synthase CbiB [Butyrivibrio sp.]MBP3781672.1 cobalamin biosynthesis protein CobD [Butyrivibrio sp.]